MCERRHNPMAEAVILICDLCKKHEPAVVRKSLDVCARHDRETRKLHGEKRRQRAKAHQIAEHVAKLKSYAKKQRQPFHLVEAQKVLGVPYGQYSSLARAVLKMIDARVVKKIGNGRYTTYQYISNQRPEKNPASTATP